MRRADEVFRVRVRGFTILEVLLAISLTLVLSGGVFAFMNNLMLRRDQSIERVTQSQAAGALIERLETDLFAALVEAGAGAGIDGNATRIRVLTRGVTPPMLGDLTSVPLGDLQGSEFTFGGESLRGGRFEAGASPELDTIAQLDRVRFRYHNGRNWSSSFNSQNAGGLPAAIEVAIWYYTGDAARPPTELESRVNTDEIEDVILQELLEEEAEREALLEEMEAQEEKPLPPPDRLRVIVIPDGPVVESGGRS